MQKETTINAFEIVPVDHNINTTDLCEMINNATLDEAVITIENYTMNIYYQKSDWEYNVLLEDQDTVTELIGISDIETINTIESFANDPKKFIELQDE